MLLAPRATIETAQKGFRDRDFKAQTGPETAAVVDCALAATGPVINMIISVVLINAYARVRQAPVVRGPVGIEMVVFAANETVLAWATKRVGHEGEEWGESIDNTFKNMPAACVWVVLGKVGVQRRLKPG